MPKLVLRLVLGLALIALVKSPAFGNSPGPARDIRSCLAQLTNWRPKLTSTVYAKIKSVLAYFHRENRFYTPLETLPQYLKQAFIAAEDAAFYTP